MMSRLQKPGHPQEPLGWRKERILLNVCSWWLSPPHFCSIAQFYLLPTHLSTLPTLFPSTWNNLELQETSVNRIKQNRRSVFHRQKLDHLCTEWSQTWLLVLNHGAVAAAFTEQGVGLDELKLDKLPSNPYHSMVVETQQSCLLNNPLGAVCSK